MMPERIPLLLDEMDRSERELERRLSQESDPEAQARLRRMRRRSIPTSVKEKRPILGRGHTARSELPDGTVVYSSSAAHDGWWGVAHAIQRPGAEELEHKQDTVAHRYQYDGPRIVGGREPPHADVIRQHHDQFLDDILAGKHDPGDS